MPRSCAISWRVWTAAGAEQRRRFAGDEENGWALRSRQMPVFAWEGKSRTGEARKGTMEAPDEAQVMQRLRQQQILPSKVRKKAREITLPNIGGVPAKHLVVFTRQF